MNVLYLSYDGLTDPLGQSQILPYLEKLSTKGAQITIISFEKKDAYQKYKTVIDKRIKAHQLTWAPLQYTKKPPVVSTVLDIYKLNKKVDKIIHQFDCIHIRSYVTGITALKMKRKYNIPFIFDMRGFWIDERIEGDIWNDKKWVFKKVINYFRKVEKNLLEKSKYIVSLTHKGKEILSQKNTSLQEKIVVIPCATDQNHFQTREDIVKNEKTTLLYIGSLGTWYLLDEMLLFYQNLKKEIPDLQFQFYTSTPLNVIKEKAKSLQVDTENIFAEFAQREHLPSMIQKCHYGICFIKPSYSKSASSPVKMGEYIAMEIPVICNTNVGDNDYIIDKYNVGISILENKSITLENINQLNNLPKNNFKNAIDDYFSIEKAVDTYWELYNQI